ncbi:MAG: hypothetical protein Crog4KO_16440 [Crocinitomicaceae bacterium]
MHNSTRTKVQFSVKLVAVLIGGILLLQGCGTHAPALIGTPLKTESTSENTPNTQEQFDSLTTYLEENLETSAMVILQNGNVIYEYGDVSEVSYLASCRKSVLSILYGKYVENGTIDLDETIGEIGIDEKDGLLPTEKKATVDQIITARSGVFHRPANGGYDKNNILERGSVQPGDYFVYNNWDFNVAGHILEVKTGNTVYEEIEEQLAIPLGFQDWNIKNQKKKTAARKSNFPAHHIYLSTRDMAKIGQLMLNKGQWEGKQLISGNWIEQITTTVTPVDTVNKRYGLNENSDYQFSYGRMWWLAENIQNNSDFEGAYTATGWGGQFITVIPKLNMVVAHKYAVPTLVNWGIRKGGVSDAQYWSLLTRFVSGNSD